MKRILVLLLSLVLTVSMFSCSKPKPLKISEEEAYEVLCDLVPRSYEFNVIFFGEGLPHEHGEYEDTTYVEVDLGESKYSSIPEIKVEVERVYSKRYLKSIYVNMFVGSKTTSSDGLLDNDVSPRYKEIEGKLMIDASYDEVNIMGKLTVVSTDVVKKTPKYVSVDAVCQDENGNEIQKRFFLTLENGVWLLDGPTY
ncbi:MAG: hypothetical protein J6D09_00215 [Clostridia bacterium]|nr:hypothetical protein [Clostridia bacterium]